jgi:hypothetical protein
VGADAGLVTVWVVSILPVIVLFAALSWSLWDGYTARRQLAELAEASARSGANGVDLDQYYDTGRLVLDPVLVESLAAETLEAQADRATVRGGAVDVEDGRVVVRLTGTVEVLLFGAMDITVEAAATPQLGGT